MNFLSFFKRNNELDSFIALKYNIPSETSDREIIQKWIFTLPQSVALAAQSELFNRGVLATPATYPNAHPDRPFVLLTIATGMIGTKEVLDIIKKHLRKPES